MLSTAPMQHLNLTVGSVNEWKQCKHDPEEVILHIRRLLILFHMNLLLKLSHSDTAPNSAFSV